MKPSPLSKAHKAILSCSCYKGSHNVLEEKNLPLFKVTVLRNQICSWTVHKNQCFSEHHETLPPRFSFSQALYMVTLRPFCQRKNL